MHGFEIFHARDRVMDWKQLLVTTVMMTSLATCGDEEGPPPPPLAEACREWVKATCTRTAECLVVDADARPAAIEQCITENEKTSTCGPQAQPVGCTERQAAERYVNCQRSARTLQCSGCNDITGCGGLCFVACYN